MPVTGTPAFDAVTVLKIDPINFADKTAPITAHAAFINTGTGSTYGQTTCRVWSQRTLEKVEELRQLMEEDVAKLVFTHRVEARPVELSDPGGIGEDLRNSGDAPQA